MGNQLENTNNDKNEFEIISTANDSNSKGLIIGNAIKAGGELLGVGIQAICNVVNSRPKTDQSAGIHTECGV